MKDIKRYTVTSALPYANGPVHIGHLAGVYVPADIYVRYLRNNGKEVLFIGGSDEHGVPITIKARKDRSKNSASRSTSIRAPRTPRIMRRRRSFSNICTTTEN